jgi:2'-5' RNA ligase
MQETRYLLALTPPQREALAYIEASSQLFASLTDGYLLREGASLPHVTLCSFHCEDDKKLSRISLRAQEWRIHQCTVRLLGLMLKKGRIPPHHYSVSLSIARESAILHLHDLSFQLLDSFGIPVLNPHRELYQPHITLAGIHWRPSEVIQLPSIIDDLITMDLPPFHFVLGRGDSMGQYLETLFEFDH